MFDESRKKHWNKKKYQFKSIERNMKLVLVRRIRWLRKKRKKNLWDARWNLHKMNTNSDYDGEHGPRVIQWDDIFISKGCYQRSRIMMKSRFYTFDFFCFNQHKNWNPFSFAHCILMKHFNKTADDNKIDYIKTFHEHLIRKVANLWTGNLTSVRLRKSNEKKSLRNS